MKENISPAQRLDTNYTSGIKMVEYKFIDWYNDSNDLYGKIGECRARYNQMIAEDPERRCSIYKIYADGTEEGILFNENCPEYKL